MFRITERVARAGVVGADCTGDYDDGCSLLVVVGWVMANWNGPRSLYSVLALWCSYELK